MQIHCIVTIGWEGTHYHVGTEAMVRGRCRRGVLVATCIRGVYIIKYNSKLIWNSLYI